MHSTDVAETDFFQSVDYSYNIRGWLTHINNSELTNDGTFNNDDDDYFGMELIYEGVLPDIPSGSGLLPPGLEIPQGFGPFDYKSSVGHTDLWDDAFEDKTQDPILWTSTKAPPSVRSVTREELFAPPIPDGLAVTGFTATTVDLIWNNVLGETSYRIGRSLTSGSGYVLISTNVENDTTFTDQNLTEGTTYYYIVRSRDASGTSGFSNEASATPASGGGTPPNDPSNLIATEDSDTQITLTWNDNSTDETEFEIHRSVNNNQNYSFLKTVTANSITTSDQGLNSSTTYFYKVRANNGALTSGFTPDASATTDAPPPSAPAAPSALTAQENSSSQITITWTDNSTNETGFEVQSSVNDATNFQFLVTAGVDEESYVNTGLSPTTTYFYRVRAINGSGESAYTNNASATTSAVSSNHEVIGYTLINASTDLPIGTINEGDEIDLSVVGSALSIRVDTDPSVVGSIRRRFDGGAFVTDNDAPYAMGTETNGDYSDMGLVAGSTYQAKAVAYTGANLSGTQGTLLTRNFSVVAGTPQVPADPTVLQFSNLTQTSVDLSWTDIATNEANYLVERSPNGTSGWTTEATLGVDAASFSDSGLTPSTPYFYRISATNITGSSGYASNDTITLDPAGSPPDIPTNLSTTTVSDTQIDIDWDENVGNTTDYTLEVSISGGAYNQLTTVSFGTTSYSHTGLTASTGYSYRVKAINATDESGYSNISSATTNAPPPPAAPTTLSFSGITESTATLNWIDNAGGAADFEIHRSINDSTNYNFLVTHTANDTDYADTGLAANTTYWYQVRATNSNGISSWLEGSTMTSNQPPPADPTNLTFPTVTESTIALIWDDNSTDETGFVIERSDNGNNELDYTALTTNSADDNTYTDTGLLPNTTYWYRVKATNGGIDSNWETQSETTSATPLAVPTNPKALTFSPTEIDVSWSDNSSNDTGFEIHRATSSGGTFTLIHTTGPDAEAYRDNSLTANTPYFYKVLATDGTSSSAFTNEVTATTAPTIAADASFGYTAQHNGNIAAIKWNNSLDGENVYSYGYDALKRITSADFATKGISLWDTNVGAYSVKNITYDLNGNIETLDRQGQFGVPTPMDHLSYTYGGGNQLLSVADATQHGEGFRDLNTTGDDYDYDDNGNMTQDLNKGITNIAYNYLNLPETITFENGNSIQYIYDAAGIKLAQKVFEDGVETKNTEYVGSNIYENDVLVSIQHEEGRLVPSATLGEYEYQFYHRDHLGNNRMTLSPDTEVTSSSATMEPVALASEQAQYNNIAETQQIDQSMAHSGIASSRLNGDEGRMVGPARLLEVHAGDTVKMEVYGRYNVNTGNNTSTVGGIASALADAFGLAGGNGESQVVYDAVTTTAAALAGSLTPADDDIPAGYLNYLLFDENYQLEDLGYQPLTTAGLNQYEKLAIDIIVPKNGYMYVYVANESALDLDVFFDDMAVTLAEGPIIQANDYYPFGLSMTGMGTAGNNPFLFNGIEKQTAIGLDWDLTNFRAYDATVGRFNHTDPLAEVVPSISPYNFSFNNPVLFNDPLGLMGQIGPGSGNHWSDPLRSVEANAMVMSSRTFNNFYGITDDNRADFTSSLGSSVPATYYTAFFAAIGQGERKLGSAQYGGVFYFYHVDPSGNFYLPYTDQQVDPSIFIPGNMPDPSAGIGLATGLESYIPVWGMGRNAIYWFQQGDISRGLLYTTLAASDIFLVKTLVTTAVRGSITLAAKHSVKKAVANPRYVGRESIALYNPKVSAMMRGKGVDRAFRDMASRNWILNPSQRLGLIKLNPMNRGADMIGKGFLKNTWWDVTTKGAWPAHELKYGVGGIPLLYK